MWWDNNSYWPPYSVHFAPITPQPPLTFIGTILCIQLKHSPLRLLRYSDNVLHHENNRWEQKRAWFTIINASPFSPIQTGLGSARYGPKRCRRKDKRSRPPRRSRCRALSGVNRDDFLSSVNVPKPELLALEVCHEHRVEFDVKW